MSETRPLFSQSMHIKTKRHFQYIFGSARCLENAFVRIYMAECFHGVPKFAFVAGKRLGNAVVRNSCKRRVKEIVRGYHGAFTSNLDIVFVAKPSLYRESFQQVNKQLCSLLKKVSLMEKKL